MKLPLGWALVLYPFELVVLRPALEKHLSFSGFNVSCSCHGILNAYITQTVSHSAPAIWILCMRHHVANVHSAGFAWCVIRAQAKAVASCQVTRPTGERQGKAGDEVHQERQERKSTSRICSPVFPQVS